jgi:Lactoylglutathione lyase and related lyases
MKAKIDHIAFRVEDLEKAVRFYTEVMGCTVADRFFVDFEDWYESALCRTGRRSDSDLRLRRGSGTAAW